MNAKKFVAKTTRECFRMMRDELGDDAMILSSRQVAEGIEMVAMLAQDVDELVGEQPTIQQTPPLHFSSGKLQRGIGHGPEDEATLNGLRQLANKLETDEARVLGQPNQAGRASKSIGERNDRRANFEPAWDNLPVSEEDNPFASIRPSAHASYRGQSGKAVRGNVAPPVLSQKMGQRSTQSIQHPRTQSPQAVRGLDAVLQAQERMTQSRQGHTRSRATLTEGETPLTQSGEWTVGIEHPASVGIDASVLDELKSMRVMLQEQRAAMAWRESNQRNPLRATLWGELAEAGFSPAYARAIVEKLPDDYTEKSAREWLQKVMLHNLPVATTNNLIETGGVFALVGPTGVGKTTTTAKLAAHCVMKWGVQSLGLITTDSYRIGAQDQLRVYGKILGVPVYTAHTTAELQSMLGLLSQRKLILIDTVGMGQRDSRVPEQLTMLADPVIQRILVLNAAAQPEMLEDVARSYGAGGAGKNGMGLSGAIISKLDEAVKIGGVVDTLMRHKLKLHFISHGQRVPEDIQPANAQALLQRALKTPKNPLFSLQANELDARMLESGALMQAWQGQVQTESENATSSVSNEWI